jgi:ubiquinone/menaquinone biosynthesis C-methylase UbiE
MPGRWFLPHGGGNMKNDLSKISEDLKKFYETSEKYLKMINYKTNPHRIEVTMQYVNFVAKEAEGYQTVLDLGCGPGLSSYLLSKRGFIVTGLDISQKFLDLSKHKESETLRLVQGNVCSLDLPDSSFDIVVSHELIEHIVKVDKALHEMQRVVKKGGKIIILAPNLFSPLSALRAIFRAKGKSPFYTTRLNALKLFIQNTFLLIKKWLQKQPDFISVTPRLDNFSGSDEDAVYLSSFLDIYKWLKNNGFKVTSATFADQRAMGKILTKYFPSFSSGIKIIAKKTQ